MVKLLKNLCPDMSYKMLAAAYTLYVAALLDIYECLSNQNSLSNFFTYIISQ